MNTDTLETMNEQELTQLISVAQGLLQTRAEKRRGDAMEQIRQIAATAQIIVKFNGSRKPKRGKVTLRDKGQIPPVSSGPIKSREK